MEILTNERTKTESMEYLAKTMAEMIDDYQMKIYELMKHVYPEMIGSTADCHECKTEDGQFDVHTRFFMHRPEETE